VALIGFTEECQRNEFMADQLRQTTSQSNASGEKESFLRKPPLTLGLEPGLRCHETPLFALTALVLFALIRQWRIWYEEDVVTIMTGNGIYRWDFSSSWTSRPEPISASGARRARLRPRGVLGQNFWQHLLLYPRFLRPPGPKFP
jgi:hypothetical protein